MYLAVVFSSLVLVIGTVRSRRTPRIRLVDAPTHDVWEIAFLAGGPGRVTDTAIAGMQEDGRLAVGGPGAVTVRRAVAHDPVEQAVLDALARTPGGALSRLRGMVMRSPAVQETGDRLADRGLMRRPRRGRGWLLMARVQVAASAVLLLGGLLMTVTGAAGDDASTVPFVLRIAPAAVLGIVVGSLCKLAHGNRLTPAGTLALRAAHATDSPGVVGGAVRPAAIVVALGGAALVADAVLRQQLLDAQSAMATAAGVSVASGDTTASSTTTSSADSGWDFSDGGSGVSWCGSADGGSGCGSSGCGGGSGCGGSSCGGGSSDSGGSSCSSGSSCGSSCGSSSSD
jgi:uncharacterized protein (TIGR04222 family)